MILHLMNFLDYKSLMLLETHMDLRYAPWMSQSPLISTMVPVLCLPLIGVGLGGYHLCPNSIFKLVLGLEKT